MIEAPTKKDQIFAEAKKDFGVQLDRRMTCADLADQLQRMKQAKNNPQNEVTLAAKPKRVRNIITGNEFDYNEMWAGEPDLLIIEWETPSGNN